MAIGPHWPDPAKKIFQFPHGRAPTLPSAKPSVQHKAMSYQRMKKRESELKAEVARMLAAAEAADAQEDETFGKDKRGDEMPDWAGDKAKRLAKIQEAMAALEADAKLAAEEERRIEAEKEKQRDAEGRKKPGKPAAPPADEPDPKAQRNFTDPESRIMKSKDGFVQAYNAQAAVDADAQIIVAHELTQCGSDQGQLVPLVAAIENNLGRKPEQASADSGYCSEANLEALVARGIDGWTDGFAEGSVGPRPVRELDYLFGGVGPVGSDRHSAERRFQMSPLRMRMIEDMKLAGLSPGTQATYIDAVRKLAAYYRRSPDQLSEEEVRAYILHLRERGAARGTFKANYYGIQYLYRYTVSRDWALFAKKRSVCRDRSGCPARLPTPRSAGCLAA